MPAADPSPTPFSRRTALRLGVTGLAAGGIAATALSGNRIAAALRADPSPGATPSPVYPPCSDTVPTPESTPTVKADSDHFYTTKYDEYKRFTARGYYRDETAYESPYLLSAPDLLTAPVRSEHQGLLAPFYRLYNKDKLDHFYTPFPDEVQQYTAQGYVDESGLDPMWVFLVPVRRSPSENPPPDLQQLFHLYNEKQTDSFFTTKLDEAKNAVARNGYAWRWTCRDKQPYVFTRPALVSGRQAVRLYRTFRFVSR